MKSLPDLPPAHVHSVSCREPVRRFLPLACLFFEEHIWCSLSSCSALPVPAASKASSYYPTNHAKLSDMGALLGVQGRVDRLGIAWAWLERPPLFPLPSTVAFSPPRGGLGLGGRVVSTRERRLVNWGGEEPGVGISTPFLPTPKLLWLGTTGGRL